MCSVWVWVWCSVVFMVVTIQNICRHCNIKMLGGHWCVTLRKGPVFRRPWISRMLWPGSQPPMAGGQLPASAADSGWEVVDE